MFVFIFGSGQSYHRTVPDGGITAGMGQDFLLHIFVHFPLFLSILEK